MNTAKVYQMSQSMHKPDDPLDLRGLPPLQPLRDGWPEIESTLRQDRRRAGKRRFAISALAAAASVTLILWLVLRQADGPSATEPSGMASKQPSLVSATPGEDGIDPGTFPEQNLDALIALSQRLEDRLRTMRTEMGELPTAYVVYQVELEDLIVQVDEELSNQPDSLSLWNQRVSLLLDVERLYATRVRREYHQMASL